MGLRMSSAGRSLLDEAEPNRLQPGDCPLLGAGRDSTLGCDCPLNDWNLLDSGALRGAGRDSTPVEPEGVTVTRGAAEAGAWREPP